MKCVALALLGILLALPCWAYDPFAFPGKGSKADFDAALKIYDQAVNLSNQGDSRGAIPKYEAAISKYPFSAAFYYNLGNAQDRIRRRIEAEKSYRKALSLSPDYANASFNLATNLFERGKYSEAYTLYKKVCSMNPTDIDSRIAFAQAAIATHHYEEAKMQISKIKEFGGKKKEGEVKQLTELLSSEWKRNGDH